MNKNEFIEKYYVERKGTHSKKWDGLEEMFGQDDLLPLWIADMDFKVSEHITDALREEMDHGVYGYFSMTDAYYESYLNWMKSHFNYDIKKEWIRFSPGVVQAITNFIQTFTKEEESVLILAPVYYPFSEAVKNTKRNLVEVDLDRVDANFKMDYQAIEKAITDYNVKMYVHCSPHNPIGRVWTEEEQAKLFEICEKHDVLIVSDEIHQDFTYGNHTHIPAMNVNNGKYNHRILTTNAASKSFNLAGLAHSHVIIADEDLRAKYDAYMETITHHGLNIFSVLATQAAYEQGEEWLETLKTVIFDNYVYIRDQFKKYIPEVTVFPLEGTYLLFIDLNPILGGLSTKEFVQDRCRLAVDYGVWFGKNYDGFIRINLSTNPAIIEEMTNRIIKEAGR